MSWRRIGRAAELRFGPGAPVQLDGHWLAVFRLDDGYAAIDNACPHASAPLCDGSVRDGKVACFLHCWQFDLRTGACDVGPDWNVRAYPVREVDGQLEIDWPGPPGAAG